MLKTDASLVGLAGILMQRQADEWRIISCCCRSTDNDEKNYSITELEALAIVYSTDKFRNYLLGRHFTILTDHCALCALNLKKPKNARLTRWKWALQEFDYTIYYVKGGVHIDVDCLSRAPVDDGFDKYIEDKILTNSPLVKSINIVTPTDVALWKSLSEQDPEAETHYAKARSRAKGYKLANSLLYYEDKLFVPKELRQEISAQAHQGHRGMRQTINKLIDYWWPNMSQEARSFVVSCEICQKNKTVRVRPSGEMNSFEAYWPLEIVAFDTHGPLPTTLNNKKHILVGIDVFTKFVFLSPLEDIKKETIGLELRKFISYFGIPNYVVSDNGPAFANEVIRDMELTYKFQHRTSTARHHRGNAPAERAIQNVEQKLLTLTHDPAHSVSWDDKLFDVAHNINTSIQISNGYSPFRLMFGLEPNEPSDLVSFHSRESRFIETRDAAVNHLRNLALENNINDQLNSRRYFEMRNRPKSYDVGDEVLIKIGEGRKSKLQSPWVGPYIIVKKSKDIYTLVRKEDQINPQANQPFMREGRGRVVARHTSELRPFYLEGENEITPNNNKNSQNSAIFKPGIMTLDRSPISALFAFLLAIGFLNPTTPSDLPQANPIVWIESKVAVSSAPTNFMAILRFGSPCSKFMQLSSSVPQKHLQDAVTHCEVFFQQHIVGRLDKLASTTVRIPRPLVNPLDSHPNNQIGKRQALLAGAALGYFVSNIWNTEPTSSDTEADNLEHLMKEADLKILQLNQRQDIMEHQTKAVREMLTLQGTIVSQRIDSIEHLMFAVPSLTV